MGRVTLVHDGQLGRDVALKELLPGGASSAAPDLTHPLAARFAREARVTAQLQHPAITPVYELGRRDDGALYYTMRFVRGRTLSEAIAECRSFAERRRLLPHFVDVCQAIAYAHSRGVLHRDIKPANVLVGEYGETVVVDWGLAKVRGGEDASASPPGGGSLVDDSDQTAHGHVLGTPAYMSPEQARGLVDEVDERSDVYSLGAVLYEILTGRRPYGGPTAAAVVSSVLADSPPEARRIDQAVPEEYSRICARAMARDRTARHGSARDLATEVEDVKLRPPKGSVRYVLERIAVAILLAMPLWILYLDWHSRAALRSALERISAKGVDVRLESPEGSFADGSAAAPGGTAASGVGALYALPWRFPALADGDSPLRRSLEALDRARSDSTAWPTPEDAARIRELVIANRPLLAELHEVARLPPGGAAAALRQAATADRYPFDWPIPDFPSTRAAAKLLSQEATLADLDGRPEEAFESLARIQEMANHYGELPWLISLLRRLVLSEEALTGFERVQDRLAPGRDPRPLEAALTSLLSAAELPRAVEGEVKSTLWAFESLKTRSASDSASAFTDSPLSLSNVGWTLYGSRPFRFWIDSDEATYLRWMADYVDGARRPYWEGRAELERIDRSSVGELGRLSPVTRRVLVSLSRVAERTAIVQSRASRAVLRIALNRYRGIYGRYPETLSVVAPRELGEALRDPLTGAPLEYRVTTDGYWLAPPPSGPTSAGSPAPAP